MAEPQVTTSFRIPWSLHKALREEAQRRNTSMNRLVLKLIKKGLRKGEIPMMPEKLAHELGFPNEDALREASRSVASVGDYTWFVAKLPDGRFAAWDDAGRHEVTETLTAALHGHLDGLNLESEDGDEGVDVNWPGIYALVAARLPENARDAVDTLNALATWDAADAPEEREAVAADILGSFARHAGLREWPGEVAKDASDDYWPVPGGIGLTTTRDGRRLVGWLSEVTTENPIFYLLPR